MQHPAKDIAPFPLAFGVGTKWFVTDRQGVDRVIVGGIKTALDTGYRHIDSAQSEFSTVATSVFERSLY